MSDNWRVGSTKSNRELIRKPEHEIIGAVTNDILILTINFRAPRIWQERLNFSPMRL
jgi:hypothetical protein